jgi:hypothetical protein
MRYVDQPYVVKLAEGGWLCLVTVGSEAEGQPGNHTAALLSRDKGQTWSAPVRVCGPYAVPLVAPGGRIFALTPQSLSWSDDGGQSWVPPRPLKLDAATLQRVSKGAAGGYEGRLGWSVSLPLVTGEGVYLAWARIGLGRPPRRTDVYLLRSANIFTAREADEITWNLMPDSETGIRGPDWDKPEHRSEEPHLVQLTDGTLYVVFRTDQGYIGHATSRDGGKSWSPASRLSYPDGRTIKNPLACPSLWKCSNGKYLLWFHNHSGRKDFRRIPGLPYADRNPAWVCGGVERKGSGEIAWSQPEVLLYSADLSYHSGRISYPGFLEDEGRYFLFETQKTVARMHEVPAEFFAALWAEAAGQPQPPAVKPVLWWRSGEAPPKMPRLPSLVQGATGFTVEMWFEIATTKHDQKLLDSRAEGIGGIAVTFCRQQALLLELADGQKHRQWEMLAPIAVESNKPQHAVFIVDGGPHIVWCVFNGKFCDGGDQRQFGWGRLDLPEPGVGVRREPVRREAMLADVSGGTELWLAGAVTTAQRSTKVLAARIYDRPLRTSEAVALFFRGPTNNQP